MKCLEVDAHFFKVARSSELTPPDLLKLTSLHEPQAWREEVKMSGMVTHHKSTGIAAIPHRQM
jgi:hypothetical protein